MKNLILYFSRPGENFISGDIKNIEKGNTKIVAEELSKLIEADLFEIETAEEYPENYYETVERAKDEFYNQKRPELKNYLEDVDDYENIYVLAPVWCGHLPMPVLTQLEKLDLEGKNIYPVVTHEGSGLAATVEDLRELEGANVKPGLSVFGHDAENSGDILYEWINDSGLQLEDYPYLYETHLHTNAASACAHNSSIEMVDAAIKRGYSGIIITEHNWGGNTSISPNLPWEEWVDAFTKGYRDALEYAKDKDFDVFWGYEAGYNGTEFLIYGIDPEWLKAHPEIIGTSIPEQYRLIHEAGGIVVHAHPFREEWYIPRVRLFPEYVDAVEGINATHSNSKSWGHDNPEFDTRAIRYAREHDLPMTAGSDIHTTSLLGGGVLFKHRLKDIGDYCESILNDDYLLTNGESIYDKDGNFLCEVEE